jgi:hypothetical protein
MPTILPDSWHFRFYCWGRRLIDTFFNTHQQWRFDPNAVQTVNLCPYIRTFGYILGLMLLHAAVFLWLVYVFIWLPSSWVKYVQINWTWFLILLDVIYWVGIVLVVVAAVVGFIWGAVILTRKCRRQQEEHAGFCFLLLEHYRGLHDQICPVFEVARPPAPPPAPQGDHPGEWFQSEVTVIPDAIIPPNDEERLP